MPSLVEVDYQTLANQQPEQKISSVSFEDDIMASLLEVDNNISAIPKHDIVASLLDVDNNNHSLAQRKEKWQLL